MTIQWSGDFRDGNLNQWPNHHLSNESLVYPQQTIVRPGYAYACRFEQRGGELWQNSERQEIHAGETTTNVYPGNVQWWGWSVYFPNDFTVPDWFIFSQFRHTGTHGGNPPLAFTIDPGTMTMNMDAKGGKYKTMSLDGVNWQEHKHVFNDIAVLPKGQWIDFKLHVKWHYDPAIGYVELWVGGNHVIPLTYCANEYLDPIDDTTPEGAYFKQGIYRNNTNTTQVIYLAGTRLGTTSADADLDATPEPSGNQLLEKLTDEFDTMHSRWSKHASVTVSSGSLDIPAATDYPSIHNGGESVKYDFAKSFAMIDIAQLPNIDNNKTSFQFMVRTIDTGRTGYRMMWYNNQLIMATLTNGAVDSGSSKTVAYDATNMKYWRISEWAGIVYFDTSPSGKSGTWTQQHNYSAGSKTIGSSYVYMASGVDGTPGTPGSAKINSLNVVPATTADNLPPTANAGPDQNVLTGATVTLDGSGSSDPDGTVASYSWTLSSKPSGSAATLAGTGATRTFTADVAGTYVGSLTVTDDKGATSTSDEVSVFVTTAAVGSGFFFDNAGSFAAAEVHFL